MGDVFQLALEINQRADEAASQRVEYQQPNEQNEQPYTAGLQEALVGGRQVRLFIDFHH